MEKQKPKVGSAVLVEHNGRFLMGERNKKNMNGYWVIPGGGVRWGESIKKAGVREIKEETNLDIEIVRFIAHKEVMNLPEEYHTVVFYHLAKLKNPEDFKIVPSEDLSKAGFFTLEEIKKLKTVDSVEWVFKKAGFLE